MEGKYGYIIAIQHDEESQDDGSADYDQNVGDHSHTVQTCSGDRVRLFPTDEPLFLLRGQDRLAPMILALYAEIARSHGRVAIAMGVEAQLTLMHQWQAEHPERLKLPD